MEILQTVTHGLCGLPVIREAGPFLENPGNFKILDIEI